MKKKICILGWYGTETLGDRAILDGIFSIFYNTYGKCEFYIGSLYPFFTERTLYEDGRIYQNTAPGCDISIFDVKVDMAEYIKKSDIVIMGGGPIMELDLLYLIYKGFCIAQKEKKKSIVFGCGLGPLKSKRLIAVAKKIILKADLVIFRDEESLKYANELIRNKKKCFALADPAIISIKQYKKQNGVDRKKYLVVNFREPDHHYPLLETSICNDFCEILKIACNHYEKIKLVPMHTFCVGQDDRKYLAQIANNVGDAKIEVLHKPLDLYELYAIYSNAEACIGMRYHSIVMQTILNGNNYIIDYTERNHGKISGFIKMLGDASYYNDKYTSIVSDKLDAKSCIDILTNNKYYEYDITKSEIESYCDLIKKI